MGGHNLTEIIMIDAAPYRTWLESIRRIQLAVKDGSANNEMLYEYQTILSEMRRNARNWIPEMDDDFFNVQAIPILDLSGRLDAEFLIMDKRKGTWNRILVDSRIIDQIVEFLNMTKTLAEEIKDKQMELPLGDGDGTNNV